MPMRPRINMLNPVGRSMSSPETDSTLNTKKNRLSSKPARHVEIRRNATPTTPMMAISHSPIHLNLDTLDIIHPPGKPTLRPHRHHIPQPQLPHKLPVPRVPAAARLGQREGTRLIVDVVRPAPLDAVLLHLICRRPVPLDEETLDGVQLVVEDGLGLRDGRLLRADVLEAETQLVRGGLSTPALEPSFEPRPRVVVGSVVGVGAAPALVAAADGEGDFAAGVGEDGGADEVLEGFRGEGFAWGFGGWGVGEDGGGWEVGGGLGWPVGEAEGWGAELGGVG